MKDRTPLMLGLIIVLALVVVYINFDLFVPGYKHPKTITNALTWQGKETSQRKLTLREGLDLQGGLQVLLEVDRSRLADVLPADLDTAANVIKNRVDTLGVTEPNVQTQGEDKIVVELPGVTDPEQAVKTVQQTALLEFIYAGKREDHALAPGDKVSTTLPTFYKDLPADKQKPFLGDPNDPLGTGKAGASARMTDTAAAASSALTNTRGTTDTSALGKTAATTETAATTGTAATGTAGVTETGATTSTAALTETGAITSTSPATATKGISGTGALTPTTIYPTVLTGNFLKDASVSMSTLGAVVVNFNLNTEGGTMMQRFTKDHVGEVMAIALDKAIVSAPTLNAVIADNGEITGNFTSEDAATLVAQLRSGALPFSLNVVGQTRIGPTLGSETVKSAVKGGLLGLLVVILFMIIYYRMPGVLAAIALLLYALITLALFRLLPVTLTLAGIAGFVLSIGMAVDANILIFERLKEELRSGRRIGQAMETGFSRAWPSIRDSNTSTLITCAILFWFGNQFGASVVKGFAVTLALGVLTSLFTAITVTRTLLKVANRAVLREEIGVSTMESTRLRRLFGF